MKRIISAAALALTTLAAIPGLTHATTHTAGAAHDHTHAATTAATTTLTDGEIRKVDKEAKKLTIRHGPIANLDMPPMTMVFQVRDAALLDTVKAGDKVKFVAEKDAGAYIVTAIETGK